MPVFRQTLLRFRQSLLGTGNPLQIAFAFRFGSFHVLADILRTDLLRRDILGLRQ